MMYRNFNPLHFAILANAVTVRLGYFFSLIVLYVAQQKNVEL